MGANQDYRTFQYEQFVEAVEGCKNAWGSHISEGLKLLERADRERQRAARCWLCRCSTPESGYLLFLASLRW